MPLRNYASPLSHPANHALPKLRMSLLCQRNSMLCQCAAPLRFAVPSLYFAAAY